MNNPLLALDPLEVEKSIFSKNEVGWKNYEGSINDDLEVLFTNVQDGDKIKTEKVESFFTPKLTDEELKLVKDRNNEHFSTYLHYCFLDPEEMKISNSKSKYAKVHCERRTLSLTVKSEISD